MTNNSFYKKIVSSHDFIYARLFTHADILLVLYCVCAQTIPLLPLSRLAPRLRRSVEGLNLELEGVFVSETAEDQHKVRHYAHVIKHRPCLSLQINLHHTHTALKLL